MSLPDNITPTDNQIEIFEFAETYLDYEIFFQFYKMPESLYVWIGSNPAYMLSLSVGMNSEYVWVWDMGLMLESVSFDDFNFGEWGCWEVFWRARDEIRFFFFGCWCVAKKTGKACFVSYSYPDLPDDVKDWVTMKVILLCAELDSEWVCWIKVFLIFFWIC